MSRQRSAAELNKRVHAHVKGCMLERMTFSLATFRRLSVSQWADEKPKESDRLGAHQPELVREVEAACDSFGAANELCAGLAGLAGPVLFIAGTGRRSIDDLRPCSDCSCCCCGDVAMVGDLLMIRRTMDRRSAGRSMQRSSRISKFQCKLISSTFARFGWLAG